MGPKNEKQFKCAKTNPKVMNECFPTDEDGRVTEGKSHNTSNITIHLFSTLNLSDIRQN